MSAGEAGERAAEYTFRILGWKMDRHQPAYKIFGMPRPGRFLVAILGKGCADYTGEDRDGRFVACEVKEAKGKSMPCSRLGKKQREYMESHSQAYVLILWTATGKVGLYKYRRTGSYKADESLCISL